MNENLKKKLDKLRDIISPMESVLVCFSGGVDSTLLLKVALDELGFDKVIGFMITGDFHQSWVSNEARCVGESLGAKIVQVDADLLLIPGIRDNSSDRCYHCKREIMNIASSKARALNMKTVVEGTVLDDLDETRPGRKAVEEMGVRSPLLEAGLTKAEVRELSREMKLDTWNNPSRTCLATRFPTGIAITSNLLDKVGKAEDALRDEGFNVFRVRYHGKLARVELALGEMPRMFHEGRRERVTKAIRDAGFKYVALDMDGYRSGSVHYPEIKTSGGKRAE